MSRTRSTSTAPKEHRWRIFRIRGTPALFMGYVYAPDEKTALDRAAAEFKIKPELANRLMARRVG